MRPRPLSDCLLANASVPPYRVASWQKSTCRLVNNGFIGPPKQRKGQPPGSDRVTVTVKIDETSMFEEIVGNADIKAQ